MDGSTRYENARKSRRGSGDFKGIKKVCASMEDLKKQFVSFLEDQVVEIKRWPEELGYSGLPELSFTKSLLNYGGYNPANSYDSKNHKRQVLVYKGKLCVSGML